MLITFRLLLTFDRELDYGAEDKDCVLKGGLSLFRHDKVRGSTVRLAIEGCTLDHVLLLALCRADGVLCLGAEDVGCIAANDTPSVATGGQAQLILNLDVGYVLFWMLKNRVELQVGDAFLES